MSPKKAYKKRKEKKNYQTTLYFFFFFFFSFATEYALSLSLPHFSVTLFNGSKTNRTEG